MNRIFRLALLPLLLCPLTDLSALGRRDGNNSAAQEQQGRAVQGVAVQVSGRVRLVGSNPFPSLVISGPDNDWYVERDEMHKLLDLQQRNVTVAGIETVLELIFASGVPAGERRMLKDVTIIAVE